MILGLWEIPNAFKRSSKERMIILQILMNGQRRYCKRPILRFHKNCQELKLQRWSQRKTFKTTGNGWMKGLCHLSAESRFLIIKQQSSIICSWQCMRCISQHAQGKAFPWSGGESDWRFSSKRSSEIALFINYEQSASSKLTSIGWTRLYLQSGW